MRSKSQHFLYATILPTLLNTSLTQPIQTTFLRQPLLHYTHPVILDRLSIYAVQTLLLIFAPLPSHPAYSSLTSILSKKSPLLLYTCGIKCAQFGWCEAASILVQKIPSNNLSRAVGVWLDFIKSVFKHQGIYRLSTGNTLDLSRALEEGLNELAEGMLLLNVRQS